MEELELKAIVLRRQGLISEVVYHCLLACAHRGDVRQFEVFVKDNVKQDIDYFEIALFRLEKLLEVVD